MSAEKYTRMLEALRPPGRLWRKDDDSVLHGFDLGAADELDRVETRGQDLIRESDPQRASELLAEWEALFELEASGTEAERRARVVARYVARQRYRPVDFQQALALLLGQAPEDVVVIENHQVDPAVLADERQMFQFYIYRDPGEPGTYDIEGAQALVDQIKPSHTRGYVIESIDFLCDDPFSLCDRDILGV